MSSLDFFLNTIYIYIYTSVFGKARQWMLPLKEACKTNLLQKKFVRGGKTPEDKGLKSSVFGRFPAGVCMLLFLKIHGSMILSLTVI